MIRLYHPDHGWGSVVRMSADGQLLVNFLGALGTWVNPAHPKVTLEGAAKLAQLRRPDHQWGYCWSCNRLTALRLVATKTRSGEGYECPHCGGVSHTPTRPAATSARPAPTIPR